MGGRGSGGNHGGGRPRKDAIARSLDGNAGHRKVVEHPSSVAAVPKPAEPVCVDEADAPNDLTVDERLVWLRLAPFALRNGTLTPEHAEAFNRMCRNIARERQYSLSPTDSGNSNHRGIQQRIEAAEAFFFPKVKGATQAPAVNPLEAKYFGGGRLGA